MDQDHLSLLPYDVLRQVCASASSALDGLSRSNKHLRNVSLPELFRRVVIEGSWEKACSRLEAMEERHDILTYVKCPTLGTLMYDRGLLTRLQDLRIQHLRRARIIPPNTVHALKAGQIAKRYASTRKASVHRTYRSQLFVRRTLLPQGAGDAKR